MCARFTLTVPDFAALAALLQIDIDPTIAALYRPRYNVAPSQVHLVLRARDSKREVFPATWGITSRWSSNDGGRDRLVNARAETARTKPTFREAFASRRCVVPADGFYEWSGAKGARRPTWFHPARGGLLHFAGLYEAAPHPATGQLDPTFTVLTTAASVDVASVHDRMPVILDPRDVDAWLGGASPEQAEALLGPAPAGALARRPVSPRVNSVDRDDSSLLHEERPPPPPGALPLFDLAGVGRGSALAGPSVGSAPARRREEASGSTSAVRTKKSPKR